MDKRRITITIPPDPTQTTKIEADGYEGKGCQAATGPIEHALGRRKSDIKKPEYYSMADSIPESDVTETGPTLLEDDLDD